MANKGVRRGLGLPSGTNPSQNIWGGVAPSASTFGSFGFSEVGQRPVPYYFRNYAPATPGQVQHGFAIEDTRYVPASTPATSNLIADGSAAAKVWMAQTFSSSVSNYTLAGVAVSGFIGAGSQPGATLATGGYLGAFAAHFDTAIPVYGIYGYQAHLGLFATTGVYATEMVAFDINAMNSFGATATTTVGYRYPSVNGGIVGATNWGLMIGLTNTVGTSTATVNQVKGQITLGGSADYTKPAAQVDIQNVLTLVSAAAPGTPTLAMTDTPASGSSVVKNIYRSYFKSTTSGANVIWTFTPVGTGRYFARGVVWARQTGGTGGTTGQGAAWTFTFGVKDAAIDGTLASTLIGTLPTGWTGPATTVGSGLINITTAGAANQNVTWHIEIELYGPLVT